MDQMSLGEVQGLSVVGTKCRETNEGGHKSESRLFINLDDTRVVTRITASASVSLILCVRGRGTRDVNSPSPVRVCIYLFCYSPPLDTRLLLFYPTVVSFPDLGH